MNNNTNLENSQFIKLIAKEFDSPTFEMVKVFKNDKLHPSKDSQGQIIITKIEQKDNEAIIFVPIKNKSSLFNFTFAIKENGNHILTSVENIAHVNISLTFSLKNIEFQKIQNNLKNISKNNLRIIAKGELLNEKLKKLASENQITIHSDEETFSYTKKLDSFIRVLQKNEKTVIDLIKLTGDNAVWIDICFYSKYPLTDVYVDNKNMKYLSQLGLELVYDIYAE